MNDEVGQKQDGESVAGEGTSAVRAVGTTRRRLLRGGAAVAPVILTFTSRPVLGFEKACVAPSRMISGNFSGFSGPTSCGGKSLADREKEANASPKPDWYADKFSGIFFPGYVGSGSVPDTLGDVFLDSYEKKGDGSAMFAAHIIAAYLNSVGAVGGVDEVLKPAQVIHMWNDIMGPGSGQYCPQISMCWDALGVIGYLQNSGIVPS
jgi:hypothetical protein